MPLFMDPFDGLAMSHNHRDWNRAFLGGCVFSTRAAVRRPNSKPVVGTNLVFGAINPHSPFVGVRRHLCCIRWIWRQTAAVSASSAGTCRAGKTRARVRRVADKRKGSVQAELR